MYRATTQSEEHSQEWLCYLRRMAGEERELGSRTPNEDTVRKARVMN